MEHGLINYTETKVFLLADEVYSIPDGGHSGTGLICEMVFVKKLKLEASGHECRKQYS